MVAKTLEAFGKRQIFGFCNEKRGGEGRHLANGGNGENDEWGKGLQTQPWLPHPLLCSVFFEMLFLSTHSLSR